MLGFDGLACHWWVLNSSTHICFAIMLQGAYDVGDFHSSLTVNLLLGVFYAAVGPLHTIADHFVADTSTAQLQQRLSWPYVALCTG